MSKIRISHLRYMAVRDKRKLVVSGKWFSGRLVDVFKYT